MMTAKRILVPHDFSETSEAARRYAVSLAEAFAARVDVLHVTDRTHSELRIASGFTVRPGSPGIEIPRVARARDIDLIVMGTHRSGLFARTVLGSVAAKVIRTAPCPVLTLRRPERPFRLSNILVGIDFSQASNVALAYGRSLCRRFGARLHLLHVQQNYFLRPVVADPHVLEARGEEQLAELLTDDEVRCLRANAVVEAFDAPANGILDYAERNAVDLIIVGTHGPRMMERLLVGSVAERVVRSAPCPVLTVHRQEYASVKRELLAKRVRSVMTAVAREQRFSASA
jgi:nucleotide-binding universal stress UspA family protein